MLKKSDSFAIRVSTGLFELQQAFGDRSVASKMNRLCISLRCIEVKQSRKSKMKSNKNFQLNQTLVLEMNILSHSESKPNFLHQMVCLDCVVSRMRLERLQRTQSESIRKAGTYQHLLQVSCTISSLPIMHCSREWGEWEGKEVKTESKKTNKNKTTECTEHSLQMFTWWINHSSFIVYWKMCKDLV